MTTYDIFLGLAILAAGFILGWLVNSLLGNSSFRVARQKSNQLLKDAKEEAQNYKNEKLIELEEETFQQKQKLEDEFRIKNQSLKKYENDLINKENNIDRKADLISKKEREIFLHQREINNKENQLHLRQEKLDRLLEEENKRLETISGLTSEEAKKILMDNLIEAAKKDAAAEAFRIIEETKKEAEIKAKNIIISAMQQTVTDHAVESTVSIVSLPNDDMKGRIIGREGRNIRAFEITTGIDVIVDDTPEAVILSGYEPYRRELA